MLYLNGQPLVSPQLTIFPDKTSQVWKLPTSTYESNRHNIFWDFQSEAEIMHLAQLMDLLNSIPNGHTTLTIKCLPYARQDKRVENNATFALRTFLKIINTMHFHKIIVTDPHNFDACRFGCQFQAVYPVKLLEQVAQSMGDNVILCYPDKGAVSKYVTVYESLYRPHIYGEKVRDQLTGNILSYQVVGECAGKDVLIVDDICDGGMTFKILAKDLLAAGAKSVVLFVTHGIFSKGLQTLKDSGIQRIYTQDGEASESDGQIIYRKL
jgi:ribose-phosphate pyrophosphokinase